MAFKNLFFRRITHVSQNGNKEFISLFIYIYADESVFSLIFIYKGDSRTL